MNKRAEDADDTHRAIAALTVATKSGARPWTGWGFIAARVGDPELAEDITQDVMVRSIASGAMDRVDNIGAWLYAAARNAVIDHYRKRRRNDGVADLDRWPEPDTDDNLLNAATRELARCLQPMLSQLHPIARDALTRVDLDGQTHREAAAQLGISISGDEVASPACATRTEGAAHRVLPGTD